MGSVVLRLYLPADRFALGLSKDEAVPQLNYREAQPHL
jgi:hypothetical protein